MTEREKILARISEALTVSAPRPGAHEEPDPPASAAPAAARLRDWLPAVGDSFEEQLAAFRRNADGLKAEFHLLESREELKGVLAGLSRAERWKKIATHAGELTDLAAAALGLPVLKTDADCDLHALEGCDAGLSECDALIAQTGSVLLTNRSAGGRALSVLPPHHVVLARREQLLRDLPAAFQLLKRKYGQDYPSMISLVTGPSRTGDIERILVLGAHGPRKLTICVV